MLEIKICTFKGFVIAIYLSILIIIIVNEDADVKKYSEK
jgi:hypothetical protein